MRKFRFFTVAILAIMLLLVCSLALAQDDEFTMVFSRRIDGTSAVSVVGRDGIVATKYQGSVVYNYSLESMPSTVYANTFACKGMTDSQFLSTWYSAANEWNSKMITPVMTHIPTLSNSYYVKHDAISTVSFDHIPGYESKTYLYFRSNAKTPGMYYVFEFDIVFNMDLKWADCSLDGTSGYDLQSYLTHEMGHVLGLGEVDDAIYSYVTMYRYGKPNDVEGRTLSNEDLYGLSKLYPLKPMPTASIPPISTPTVPPTTLPTSAPTPTPPSTSAPTPTVPPVPTTPPTEELYGRVNTASGSLNVRSAPDTSAKVITRLAKNTNVRILDTSIPGWYKISYLNYVGYVSSAYIVLDIPKPTAAPTSAPTPVPTPAPTESPIGEYKYVKTDGSNLNMRSSMTINSTNVIAKIPNGAKVAFLGETGDWSKIVYAGKTGYVKSEYLRN